MIKILIVDDSASIRMFLQRAFSADRELSVVGEAKDGEEAVALANTLAPDVITMDIRMPLLNGLDATRRIMETRPVPIIILSGVLDTAELVSSFRAMSAGAVAALPKPRGEGHPDHEKDVRALIQTVKLMSEVKVIRRWPRASKKSPAPRSGNSMASPLHSGLQVVAIGASTGGPVVIQTILGSLGKNFQLPVLIVQHMAAGFIGGFADWLAGSTGMPVKVAAHGDRLRSGHVYIAPDGHHMLADSDGRVKLCNADGQGLCPAISPLFRSVAEVYGSNGAGVLLTGMGRDGVDGLLLLKERGGVTIVQDEASSIIYGMPGEAMKAGAALYALSPDKIAGMLVEMGTSATVRL